MIDELVREGALRMLAETLRAEVDEYIAQFGDQRDANRRRFVGTTATTSLVRCPPAPGGEVVVPRVNDRRTEPDTGERRRFALAILPPRVPQDPEDQRGAAALPARAVDLTKNIARAISAFQVLFCA